MTQPTREWRIILDLCGGSGSWGKPYSDAGYRVILVTLPENDVRTYQPPANVHGILAAPPCDEFSIAKDHRLTRNLSKGMEIVQACMRIVEETKPVWWAMENPAGHLRRLLGPHQFSFQPYEFGNAWTKRTLLWGEFNKPKKVYRRYEDVPKIAGLYVRPGRKTASLAFNHLSHKKLIRELDPFTAHNDASFRAITPPGFAQAFFEANP